MILYAFSVLRTDSWEHPYLVWNLILAWIPLLLAIRLTVVLRDKLWSSWEGIGLSLAWLLFLPNTFYMISDFIHLQKVQRTDVVYDTVLFTSFVYTALILGFSSLYLIHLQLRERLRPRLDGIWVGIILFLCSIAIYIGRDLRWNSWDILTNPGGLLFDVSDRMIHPASYPQMFITIGSFFILLTSMYYLLLAGARHVRTYEV